MKYKQYPKYIQLAIDRSIRHWERMIKWAKKQKKSLLVSGYDNPDMETEIGEYWNAYYCNLCKAFKTKEGDELCFNNKIYCPLADKYGECGVRGSENNFLRVHNSKTWGQWVYNANIMLKQLQSLRR